MRLRLPTTNCVTSARGSHNLMPSLNYLTPRSSPPLKLRAYPHQGRRRQQICTTDDHELPIGVGRMCTHTQRAYKCCHWVAQPYKTTHSVNGHRSGSMLYMHKKKTRQKETQTHTHPNAPVELEHSPNHMLNGRGMQRSKISPNAPQPPNHNAQRRTQLPNTQVNGRIELNVIRTSKDQSWAT